jgi:hypothetical protein
VLECLWKRRLYRSESDGWLLMRFGVHFRARVRWLLLMKVGVDLWWDLLRLGAITFSWWMCYGTAALTCMHAICFKSRGCMHASRENRTKYEPPAYVECIDWCLPFVTHKSRQEIAKLPDAACAYLIDALLNRKLRHIYAHNSSYLQCGYSPRFVGSRTTWKLRAHW